MSRTPSEHRQAVSELIGSRPTTHLPAPDALGLTLADEVISPAFSPAFDNSQMDGYAVGAGYLGGATLPIGPTIPAGVDTRVLYPDGIGEVAAPVMTGAAIPTGTAAIIPVEHCDPPEFVDGEGNREGALHMVHTAAGGNGATHPPTVTIPPSKSGQFIRTRGSDLREGDVLFRRGEAINERTIGACALLGIDRLPVAEPARVVICTGGQEIGKASSFTIPDANAPMLRALCTRHRIEVVGHIQTKDDPAALKEELVGVVHECEPTAVITSGGISHGKFEVVRQVLEPLGGWFGHVSQQPGGPQGLGRLPGGTPVICLPGNPVSTAVSFRLFVAPVLGEAAEPFVARASAELEGLPGKDCFARALVEFVDGGIGVRALEGRGSHLLAQSAEANAFVRIPADTTVRAGELVEVYPL